MPEFVEFPATYGRMKMQRSDACKPRKHEIIAVWIYDGIPFVSAGWIGEKPMNWKTLGYSPLSA